MDLTFFLRGLNCLQSITQSVSGSNAHTHTQSHPYSHTHQMHGSEEDDLALQLQTSCGGFHCVAITATPTTLSLRNRSTRASDLHSSIFKCVSSSGLTVVTLKVSL